VSECVCVGGISRTSTKVQLKEDEIEARDELQSSILFDFIRFYSAKILKCVAFAQENRVGATISNVLNVVGLRTRNGTCSVR
jgi:hypothetical protein